MRLTPHFCMSEAGSCAYGYPHSARIRGVWYTICVAEVLRYVEILRVISTLFPITKTKTLLSRECFSLSSCLSFSQMQTYIENVGIKNALGYQSVFACLKVSLSLSWCEEIPGKSHDRQEPDVGIEDAGLRDRTCNPKPDSLSDITYRTHGVFPP